MRWGEIILVGIVLGFLLSCLLIFVLHFFEAISSHSILKWFLLSWGGSTVFFVYRLYRMQDKQNNRRDWI
jgi:hypothetical protein